MSKEAKGKIKDSIFTNLFGQKRYMRELYLALHPEDSISEDELKTVTLENVLVDDIYNDLGFLAKDTLITMVEAQSTWNWNMALRLLMYYVETVRKEYVGVESEKLYGSKAIFIPRPEMYVVYTGSRQERPETITLSSAHFMGQKSDVEVTIHMLYGGGSDIIGQYVEFTRVIDSWIRKLGRTKDAVLEAISECVKRNVLKEYLSDHESEVLDIMTTLFDQESLTKQMMNRQYRMGDARRLVNDVENIMSHYGVSLAEACDVTRCSVEEYYRAKNLLNSEM